MRRFKGNSNGERYIGNKITRVVHDLDNEKPQCKIDETMESGNDVAFKYWYEAKMDKYSICSYCFEITFNEFKSR